MQLLPSPDRRINYRLGSIYSVITALLLSTQEPFSFLAAKRFSVTQFVFLTQVALLMSIPLLTVRTTSRRDLILLLGHTANYCKLGVIFAVGMGGLSNAHPIIISAIINLQPFWAALVALLIARVPIPQYRRQSFSVASSARFSARWRSPGARSARPIGRSWANWLIAPCMGLGSMPFQYRSARR
jgi:hypothetical protein